MSRFIASIVALLLTSLSDAKAWPDQPVKMVVPFAAGGTTDVMARIVAERVAALLGRPVILEMSRAPAATAARPLSASLAPTVTRS